MKNMSHTPTRREFLKTAGLGGAALVTTGEGKNMAALHTSPNEPQMPEAAPIQLSAAPLDLSPASWIWYPSERTLSNTVILFRKSISLTSQVVKATGWIVADSRYLLSVNGMRVQWGPAPSDPRCYEVDPVDLTKFLHQGENVIAAQVLYYGQGDGTYPIGKPGFIFSLDVRLADDTTFRLVSDSTWLAHLSRSWRPGHYKRWYVRALQEEFDARLFPYGWDIPGYKTSSAWLPAMKLGCPADRPPICSNYPDYLLETSAGKTTAQLRARSIPLLKEIEIPAKQLAETYRITWLREPEEYFESVTPDSFTAEKSNAVEEAEQGVWRVQLENTSGAALTFEFEEQIVGFPYFTINAPAGTIIELMVQEGHTIGGPPIMNTHIHSWARFICREGRNRFQTFDYESLRWVQLHIHGAAGEITIRDVGLLRRMFPWPHAPVLKCPEPTLQRLMNACFNTLYNSAQETVVDGMGRERQQYSGDGGHQLHGIHIALGEPRLPARFISTFSMGLTLDGFFLDCWPAYDRLARLMERQLGLTEWGPLLDHGVGFIFDCYYHYMYTGDLDTIRQVFPRLQRFVTYLKRIQSKNGLLPVENLGVPSVWIDHNAYKRDHQHHKQCAFNLYAAAMLKSAFAPLAGALGDRPWEEAAQELSSMILSAATRAFWDKGRRVFVINLPWLAHEQELRLCDRSLATSILFDQCVRGNIGPALKALVETPPEMGFSYPANACWRLWALSKGGRTDVVLKELRGRWATMESVLLNNTIGETWKPAPDSADLWSHCAVVPLYVMYMSIAGIQPTAPGFSRCRISPQLADLEGLELAVPTVRGKLHFQATGRPGSRELTIALPVRCEGELLLDAREKTDLPRIHGKEMPGHVLYRLAPGSETRIGLEFS
jgi:hypothetical protein